MVSHRVEGHIACACKVPGRGLDQKSGRCGRLARRAGFERLGLLALSARSGRSSIVNAAAQSGINRLRAFAESGLNVGLALSAH
jgi:hypothetical protein